MPHGGARQPIGFGRAPIAIAFREHPLVGILHSPRVVLPRDGGAAEPTGGAAGGGPALPGTLGVVVCNPLGYEAMSAHRTLRFMAECLARQGIAVVRFDHDGCGDSPCSPSDRGRLGAWTQGIVAAIREVRARGADRVGLVGLRMGATLAVLAAAEEGGVDAVALWSPIVSGRAHVRELRAFRLLQDPKHAASNYKRVDGGEEVGGFLFAKETLDDLASIDLLVGSGRVARRALIVSKADRSPDDAKLAASLSARGADVRVVTDAGYAKMMRDDPYEGIVPVETVESVVAWMGEGLGSSSANPDVAAGAAAAATTTASPGPLPARALPVVVDVPRVEAGQPLRETFVLFGEDERLFGVVTEPREASRADRPAVCFFNVGANHHVGPHRMNVDLARQLAALGYVTFRFDASGLGESPPAPGGRENRIYTMAAVGDAIRAMDLLRDKWGVSRFVLVGLCSGAYVAYHTAVADARVVGQVLLSPYAFEWKEGDPVTPSAREQFRTFKSTRFYLQSLFDPATWGRAARGEVNLVAIGELLVERGKERIHTALPHVAAFVRRKRRPRTDVERAFRAMCARGVESLLVLGFSDGGLDMVARYLGHDARRMRGYTNFEMLVLDDADHTFTSLKAQEKLRWILAEYMSTRFR